MSSLEEVSSHYIKHEEDRICQGDIFKEILQLVESGEQLLEYGVIISQDCDLQQDFHSRNENKENNNNYLPSILVCPAYLSQRFKTGEHILGQKMRSFNEREYKKILKNDSERRYHWLIDFKHYYTIPRNICTHLKKKII